MKGIFDKIRTPDKNIKMKNKIINTFLIFSGGVALGVFSKWLDNLSIDNTIWCQHIIGILDLRNVFSMLGIWLLIAVAISVFSKTALRASLNVFLFFVGMTVSYHLYTIYFSGFNPMNYMMIWYGMTLISLILAYICWYAKGESKVSLILSSFILCVMFLSSFSIGIWYFDVRSIIDIIIFIGAVIVLYVNPKNTIYSFIIALVLSLMLSTAL